MYVQAWRKHRAGQPLEPLERQLAEVIEQHPEYVRLIEAGDSALEGDFAALGGAENPFLHMGLHLALRELVSTDRPAGVAAIHRALCARFGERHCAEHAMLEPLAETLWQAQSHGEAPDERRLLERLERLLAAGSGHA